MIATAAESKASVVIVATVTVATKLSEALYNTVAIVALVVVVVVEFVAAAAAYRSGTAIATTYLWYH